MTERWRRELGLLERVGPSTEVLDRARHGPQLPLPSPRPGRRIVAAALALAVAVGGGVGAYAALHGRGSSSPAGQEEGPFRGLWPEDFLADVRRAQARVDGGDPDVRWRLDPEAVGTHFAQESLGWADPVVAVADQGGVGGEILDVSTYPPPCPAPGCPPWLLTRRVQVTVDQLDRLGPTGIWSVTGVSSVEAPALEASWHLPLSAGQDVPSGLELSVPLSVPEGDAVVAGYGYECGGGTMSAFSTVQQRQDGIDFPVGGASLSEDCTTTGGQPSPGAPGELGRPLDGYVYVAVVHGWNPDDPWAPVISGPPSGVTLVSLEAVPVRFVPAT
jgi:hypothetical protein